jgi:oligopeptide/dipeptide ABC transporter ATP-binding protein
MYDIDKPAEERLLYIENLNVRFHVAEGVHHAIRGLSLSIKRGESWGLVGESGSGKTVTALALMRLFHNTSGTAEGTIVFDGRDLLALSDEEARQIRGNEIAMIFQEPMTSLNPIHTCGRQVMEPLMVHKRLTKKEAAARALELLTITGISAPAARMREYPHQLSGGMRQRVMIAMALACKPKLLIADEPTTALDVTIQAQILELMKELRRETGTAIIMITHDLGVIAEMCDHVAVMYAGQIVEICRVEDLFKLPFHPYSAALRFSIPQIAKREKRLYSIKWAVLDPFNLPTGCAFVSRCSVAAEECQHCPPELVEVEPGRFVRCPFWKEHIVGFKDRI